MYTTESISNLPTDKIAILFSGGVDSTAIIEEITKAGKKAFPISFDDDSCNYRTRRSVAVEQIIGHYALAESHYLIRTYNSEFLRFQGTFGLIPGYKMSMQIAAMAYCQRLGIQYLAMGYSKENDEYPYTFKDEQLPFIEAITVLYNTIYDANIVIAVPYHSLTKAEIIQQAEKAPFEKTISCRSTTFGGLVHCGKCLPCHSRRNGFIDADRTDPTIYHYSADEMESVVYESIGTAIVNPNKRYER